MEDLLLLAVLGYYIHSLCSPVLSFDYHLLLRTPPSEWFQIADGVFTSHKNSVTFSEEKPVENKTDKKYKTDMLTKFDPFFQARAGQILDLRTQDEKKATRVSAFKA